jgi:Cu/Ag efflux protein CusF
MRRIVVGAAAAFALIALLFGAATAAQHDLTEGVVTKIDLPTERITLKHALSSPGQGDVEGRCSRRQGHISC